MAGITFLIPGRESSDLQLQRGAAAAAPAPGVIGTLVRRVVVSSQRGGDGGTVPVTAVPGQDVVVLHLEGGPELVLHPEHARDLLLSQSATPVARGRIGEAAAVPVPVRLQWHGLEHDVPARGGTRGFLGDVLLKAVDVVTGSVAGKGARFATSAVVKRFDAQTAGAVYALRPDALPSLKDASTPLDAVPAAPDGAASLVLVHGTFSTTSGTFGKLWSHHPDRVKSLFTRYADRVFALDHPTLTVSPAGNAVTLARALPRGARLHLVTHSRGGLVAEVLARVCANPADSFKGLSGKAKSELRELADLVSSKSLAVDRIVRVACPVRGTLLASRRLDAYLSVFKWTLELAGVPVAPVLVEFLAEVARQRTDPDELPGLAAQMPDSALVQWLHSSGESIRGDLRVVAGDMDGDSVTSWLKTLLADAFYWTDNDLVVQTRSMYGGMPRAGGGTFVLDQGGRVSHFNYFSNDHTAAAIVNALVQERPQNFATIGPLSWSGQSASGARAAVRPVSGDSRRPAVLLVPGLFGTHLKAGGRRVWLDRNLAEGLSALQYPSRSAVDVDGLLDTYDDLAAFLAATHDVIEFPYDWRRPLENVAADLAGAVSAALAARSRAGVPVRIVAHSTGGLLVRALQLEKPEIWKRLVSVPGARVLMLGTPHAGCWMPMQV